MLSALRKLDRPVPRGVAMVIAAAVTAGLLVGAAPHAAREILWGLGIVGAGCVVGGVGVWIADVRARRRRAVRVAPPRCPECGYDLTGIPEREMELEGLRVVRVTCAECGWAEV